MTSRPPNTTCHRCGDPCYVRPNQMARQKTWFCGMDCFRAQTPTARVYTCENKDCKTEFTRTKVGTGTPRFCSRSCANTSRRGTRYKTYESPLAPKVYVSRNVHRRHVLIERDGEACTVCGLGPEWNGVPLTLQVDHIDGDRTNNDPVNWRLLCPNCHSQTETFGGRNARRRAAAARSPATP